MAAWMILSCSEMLQLLALSLPNKRSIFLSHHFEYDQFTAPLMLGGTAPSSRVPGSPGGRLRQAVIFCRIRPSSAPPPKGHNELGALRHRHHVRLIQVSGWPLRLD
jgi:hypothetical protein